MTRTVTLPLGPFGREAFDRLLAHGHGSPEAALRTAALYYLSDRDAGTARPAPRFRSVPPPGPGLRVAYDDETWAALGDESRRQGVPPEALAAHALLYYLGDLESGRLAERLDQGLEGE